MPIEPPPPVVDSGRVLSYAIVPDDLAFIQRNTLFVNSVPMGRVPCLAIIEQLSDGDVLLLHCDADWYANGAAGTPSHSIDDLKASAERSYPGLAAHWVDVNTTREDALAYYDAEWPMSRCSYCGRRAYETESMWEGASSTVCNHCRLQHPEAALHTAVPEVPKHDGCSFCGKHMRDVRSMFESKRAAICGECVRRLNKALDEDRNAG